MLWTRSLFHCWVLLQFQLLLWISNPPSRVRESLNEMFSKDTLTLNSYGSIKPEAELRDQTLNSDFIFKNDLFLDLLLIRLKQVTLSF